MKLLLGSVWMAGTSSLGLRSSVARRHPDAEVVNMMGWPGFIAIVPWGLHLGVQADHRGRSAPDSGAGWRPGAPVRRCEVWNFNLVSRSETRGGM